MTLFAADTNAGTQEQLAAYRQQIDSRRGCFEFCVLRFESFGRRAAEAVQVGQFKAENHSKPKTQN
jgi:chorismate mutase